MVPPPLASFHPPTGLSKNHSFRGKLYGSRPPSGGCTARSKSPMSCSTRPPSAGRFSTLSPTSSRPSSAWLSRPSSAAPGSRPRSAALGGQSSRSGGRIKSSTILLSDTSLPSDNPHVKNKNRPTSPKVLKGTPPDYGKNQSTANSSIGQTREQRRNNRTSQPTKSYFGNNRTSQNNITQSKNNKVNLFAKVSEQKINSKNSLSGVLGLHYVPQNTGSTPHLPPRPAHVPQNQPSVPRTTSIWTSTKCTKTKTPPLVSIRAIEDASHKRPYGPEILPEAQSSVPDIQETASYKSTGPLSASDDDLLSVLSVSPLIGVDEDIKTKEDGPSPSPSDDVELTPPLPVDRKDVGTDDPVDGGGVQKLFWAQLMDRFVEVSQREQTSSGLISLCSVDSTPREATHITFRPSPLDLDDADGVKDSIIEDENVSVVEIEPNEATRRTPSRQSRESRRLTLWEDSIKNNINQKECIIHAESAIRSYYSCFGYGHLPDDLLRVEALLSLRQYKEAWKKLRTAKVPTDEYLLSRYKRLENLCKFAKTHSQNDLSAEEGQKRRKILQEGVQKNNFVDEPRVMSPTNFLSSAKEDVENEVPTATELMLDKVDDGLPYLTYKSILQLQDYHQQKEYGKMAVMLQNFHAFQSFPAKGIAAMISKSKILHLPSRNILFQRNKEVEVVHVLLRGSISHLKTVEDEIELDEEIVVETSFDGQLIGDNRYTQTYRTTAIAQEESWVLEIPRSVYHRNDREKGYVSTKSMNMLHGIDVLSSIQDNDLRTFILRVDTVHFQHHDQIVSKDDKLSQFYIILEGQAELRSNSNTTEFIFRTLLPGDSFGYGFLAGQETKIEVDVIVTSAELSCFCVSTKTLVTLNQNVYEPVVEAAKQHIKKCGNELTLQPYKEKMRKMLYWKKLQKKIVNDHRSIKSYRYR